MHFPTGLKDCCQHTLHRGSEKAEDRLLPASSDGISREPNSLRWALRRQAAISGIPRVKARNCPTVIKSCSPCERKPCARAAGRRQSICFRPPFPSQGFPA
jgi:hypothetical protein